MTRLELERESLEKDHSDQLVQLEQDEATLRVFLVVPGTTFIAPGGQELLPDAPVTLPVLADQPAAPSAHVPERYGAHSVAEAAALAAAGSGASLLGRRSISPDRMATTALASIQNTSP